MESLTTRVPIYIRVKNPGDDDAFNVTVDRLNFAFQHNVVGPALITQAFIPLLQKGNRKVIMNMTSGLASIGLDIGPKCCAYSISKAALNMLVRVKDKTFMKLYF